MPLNDNLRGSRSFFDLSHKLLTSFNVGSLIPILSQEIYPGDTIKLSTKSIVRLETLLKPIFDDLYIDTYFFYCPTRLVWDKFKEFFGENPNRPWVEANEYSVPQITSPEGGYNVDSLANYFKIPINVGGLKFSSLLFRAYCKTYNDWFRDVNLQYELDYNIDSTDVQGSNGDSTTSPITTAALGGQIPNISKFRDYFTSCLPSSQRGEPVSIPLGTMSELPLKFYGQDESSKWQSYADAETVVGMINPEGASGVRALTANIGSAGPIAYSSASSPSGGYSNGLRILNGYVGSDFVSTNADINDLRKAFALQGILERSARSGSRYIDYLLSAFGVSNGDLMLDRVEYLGGCRSNINVNEVLQTSQTTSDSPLGNEAAHSVSRNFHEDFTKTFTEHGFLIGLCAVRYVHSYDRGLPRYLSRKKRYDFYDPMLAFLGEQPVYNKEIYAQGNEEDDKVFGYNEAWADLRFVPNSVTGMMRTNYDQSLDVWHLADKYVELPKLSADFIVEDKSNVDRVIAVDSSNSHQFIAGFYFDMKAYRKLPSYSIPKLIA